MLSRPSTPVQPTSFFSWSKLKFEGESRMGAGHPEMSLHRKVKT